LGVEVELRDGNDVARVLTSAADARVDGGSGRDRLFGASAVDRLVGGPGADSVTGGRGNDFLRGGSGDDVLRGGPGRDHLDGGRGTDDMAGGRGRDIVIYGTQSGPAARVTVTLDGRANDGSVTERDHVRRDVEGAITVGSAPGSSLIGNSHPNFLRLGGRGTVDGRAGADEISGSGTVLGGPGQDVIAGGGRVFGGPGGDRLESTEPGLFDGGTGSDLLRKSVQVSGTVEADWSASFVGGPGDDEIEAVDLLCEEHQDYSCITYVVSPFKDTVACGAGRDRTELDVRDLVLGGCERRRVRR
jgi:Ca2+-binding RTX toxin-like protein